MDKEEEKLGRRCQDMKEQRLSRRCPHMKEKQNWAVTSGHGGLETRWVMSRQGGGGTETRGTSDQCMGPNYFSIYV